MSGSAFAQSAAVDTGCHAEASLEGARQGEAVCLQGVSQAPVLRGEQQRARDAVFLEHGWHQAPVRPGELSAEEEAAEAADTSHHLGEVLRRGRCRGVRDERWTYIRNEADVEELYDRQSDPDELVNRAGDPALSDTVIAYRTRLLDWMVATDEPCRWA